MPDAAALVTALREGRTWQQVADVLAEHGAAHPRSYWSGVADGRFAPPRREHNALRAACGLPDIPPTPAEAVADSGVTNVLRGSDAPDLALLTREEGDV